MCAPAINLILIEEIIVFNVIDYLLIVSHRQAGDVTQGLAKMRN